MKCFPRNVDRDTEGASRTENESDRGKNKRQERWMSHCAEDKTYSSVPMEMSQTGLKHKAVFLTFLFCALVILPYDLLRLPRSNPACELPPKEELSPRVPRPIKSLSLRLFQKGCNLLSPSHVLSDLFHHHRCDYHPAYLVPHAAAAQCDWTSSGGLNEKQPPCWAELNSCLSIVVF